jgi:hypothetical protein
MHVLNYRVLIPECDRNTKYNINLNTKLKKTKERKLGQQKSELKPGDPEELSSLF